MDFSKFLKVATDAGDSGLLLTMALVGVALLWFFHSRRLAWLLLRSVLLAGVLITVLKIFFLSCGTHWIPGLVSPSGHACLSAVVYGTLGTVLAGGRTWPVRTLIGTLVLFIVGVISVSRVALGVHTLLEVIVGLGAGAIAQAWFIYSYARMEPLRIDGRTFGLALAATVLVAFGMRLPAESIIRHFARRVAFHCDGASASAATRVLGLPQPARSKVLRSSARERAV